MGIVVEAAVLVAASINIFNMQWAADPQEQPVAGAEHSSTDDDILSWATDKVCRVGDNICKQVISEHSSMFYKVYFY